MLGNAAKSSTRPGLQYMRDSGSITSGMASMAGCAAVCTGAPVLSFLFSGGTSLKYQNVAYLQASASGILASWSHH